MLSERIARFVHSAQTHFNKGSAGARLETDNMTRQKIASGDAGTDMPCLGCIREKRIRYDDSHSQLSLLFS